MAQFFHLTVQEGKELRDVQRFTKMSPYAVVEVLGQELKTNTLASAGVQADWRQRFMVTVTAEELASEFITVKVTVCNKNKALVGTCKSILPSFTAGVTKCRWYDLKTAKGEPAGKVMLEVDWSGCKAAAAAAPTTSAAPPVSAAAAPAPASATAAPAQRPPGYGARGPPPQYGAPPAHYGAPPAQYGAPPAQYGGAPPAQYGAPPAQYGGAPPAQYGAPPAQYGAPPAHYGAPPARYGAPPAHYGAPQASHQPPRSAAPPAAVAYASPPPPRYGAPPPGYGAVSQPYSAPAASTAVYATPYTPTAATPAPAAPVAAAPSGPYVPRELDNKYVNLQVLGAGNFGIAYKAVSRADDEVYAVKLIKISSSGDLDEIKSEAKILFPLVHQNIVRYFNAFMHTSSTGQLYYGLVMEFCEQGHLNDVIEKARKTGERINDGQIGLWVYQIACALAYLHGHNVLHRDLKGDNVFLSKNNAKLADFGLAKAGATSGQAGAYAYESPEQARGLKYDGRNDVWALGCLLTELLTLRFVTERGTGAIALDHTIVRTMVEETCAIHPELGGWARRMLEMDPERRPSAQQLVDELTPHVRSFEGRLAAPPVRMTHTPTAHASNPASGAGSGGAGSGGAGSGAGAGARPAVPAAVPAAVAPAPASAPAPAPSPAPAPAAAPLASPGAASGGGSPAPMIRLRCNQCGGQMDCRLDTHVNLCPTCHSAVVHLPCNACRRPLSFLKGTPFIVCPMCRAHNDLSRIPF